MLDDQRAHLTRARLKDADTPRQDVGLLLGVVLRRDATGIPEGSAAIGCEDETVSSAQCNETAS
jgi:hypothetical protein